MKFIFVALTLIFISAFAAEVEWIVENDLSMKNGKADVLVIMTNDGSLEKLNTDGLSWDEIGYKVTGHKMAIALEQQKELLDIVKSLGLKHTSYWVTNCIAIYEAPEDLIRAIAKRSDVKLIMTNREFQVPLLPEEQPDLKAIDTNFNNSEAVEWNVKWVNADKVWAKGFEGQNMVTGNADTGIMYNHEALVTAYRGNKGNNQFDHNYNWFDGLRDFPSCGQCPCKGKVPCDDQGHGTHCMGTTSGGVARKIGVAPKSKWIGCRAFSDMARRASPATFLNCLQFFAAPTDLEGRNPKPELRPHTTSHSYGCPTSYCPNSEFLKQAAETLKKTGVYMIVSAGNSGPSCSSINRPPGHMENIVSVGASGTNTNTIASFSSRGPIRLDNSNRRKPDITAPGVSVWSSVTGNRYASYSGTSMASPNVNGVVALLWSAVPKLVRKIDETNKIIFNSATKMDVQNTCGSSGTPNSVYGYGIINAEKALSMALSEYGDK